MFFHTWVTNFQAIFRAVQHVRMLFIMVLKKQIYILFRVDQVLLFCTKNNGIIRNAIEENVLFYRVVRVIPNWLYLQMKKKSQT